VAHPHKILSLHFFLQEILHMTFPFIYIVQEHKNDGTFVFRSIFSGMWTGDVIP